MSDVRYYVHQVFQRTGPCSWAKDVSLPMVHFWNLLGISSSPFVEKNTFHAMMQDPSIQGSIAGLNDAEVPLMLRSLAVDEAATFGMNGSEVLSYRLSRFFGAWWACALRHRFEMKQRDVPTFKEALEYARMLESTDLGVPMRDELRFTKNRTEEPIADGWRPPTSYVTNRGGSRYAINKDCSGELTIANTEHSVDVVRVSFYMEPPSLLRFNARVLSPHARIRNMITAARCVIAMRVNLHADDVKEFRRVTEALVKKDSEAPTHIWASMKSILDELDQMVVK